MDDSWYFDSIETETAQIYHIYDQCIRKIKSKYQKLVIFNVFMIKACFCQVLHVKMI